jgi:hypothetical protein
MRLCGPLVHDARRQQDSKSSSRCRIEGLHLRSWGIQPKSGCHAPELTAG